MNDATFLCWLRVQAIRFLAAAIVFAAPELGAEPCDFSYIPLNEPFSSPDYGYQIVPSNELTDSEQTRFSKQLSDVRAVLRSDDLKTTILIGWTALPANFTRFTRTQVVQGLRQKAEANRERAALSGAKLTYLVNDSNPVSLYIDLTYDIDGVPHKDISVRIIANPFCELSIKMTGKLSHALEGRFLNMKSDFELIREFIHDAYGQVAFAQNVPRFSLPGLARQAFALVGSGLLCLALYSLYRRTFIPRPGRLALVYSAVVAVLSVIAIAATIVFNEWFDQHSTQLPYDDIVYFGVILALHVWSYQSAVPGATAIATLFLISAIITRNSLSLISVGAVPTAYLAFSGAMSLAGLCVLIFTSERKPPK